LPFYLQNVQKEIIVIIGGPGTGKSTIINQLTSLGHCCYPEISRQVTAEAKKLGIDQLFLENPLLAKNFSKEELNNLKMHKKNLIR
jgi:predicted ATPase